MSAEVLRQAAALMRERASAATEGPWIVDPARSLGEHGDGMWKTIWCVEPDDDRPGYTTADCALESDAIHIASWSPPIALAVAEWLDRTADENDAEAGSPLEFLNFIDPGELAALAFARAYLGENA